MVGVDPGFGAEVVGAAGRASPPFVVVGFPRAVVDVRVVLVAATVGRTVVAVKTSVTGAVFRPVRNPLPKKAIAVTTPPTTKPARAPRAERAEAGIGGLVCGGSGATGGGPDGACHGGTTGIGLVGAADQPAPGCCGAGDCGGAMPGEVVQSVTHSTVPWRA